VDALTAAAPFAEQAAGLPPATQTAVGAYLSLANSCLSSAQTVLEAATVPTAAASAQIAAACADDVLTAPVLPASTPADVTAAVAAAAAAVAKFRNSLPKPSAGLFLPHPEFVNGFAGSKPRKLKIDRKRLAKIRSKLDALGARLSGQR
jgi:hypothetical protein